MAAPSRPSMAECDAQICVPGSPFEVITVEINGRPTKVWKNSPTSYRRHLLASMDKFADRVMINSPAPEPAEATVREIYTFAEIKRRAVDVAAWLVKQGVRCGDNVGLVGFNSAAWVVAWTAIHLIGAVPVMVNSAVTPDSMAHCVRLARPSLVLADAISAVTLDKLKAELPDVKKIVSWQKTDHLKYNKVDVVDFSNMGSSFADAEKILKGEGFGIEQQNPESNAVVFFTSGTTGYPKAVVISHRASLHNVISSVQPLLRAGLRMGATMEMVQEMLASAPQEQGVVLMAIPFFHVTGCLSILLKSFSDGHQLVLMRRFNVDEAVKLMIDTKVSIISAVPAIIMAVMQSPKLPKDFPMTGVSYGGAPCPSRMPNDLTSRWPSLGMSIVQAWGMTETSAPHTVIVGQDYFERNKSCGYPLPVAEVRIVDSETKRILGTGERGEIQARGQTVMKGYLNDEKATAAAIDKDGWFSTGDAGYLDEDGFLYISDRIKDIIIRGGENISSEEVENAIYLDDRIAEAAAVPVPDLDGVLGELVGLAVSLRQGQKATADSIIEGAYKRLRSHARPVFVYVSPEPLPRNANGKLVKTEIKKTVTALYEKSRKRTAKL